MSTADDSETILIALLDHLVEYVPRFKTVGRRVRFWTDSFEQPALFLRHTGDVDNYQGDTFDRRTVEAELWVYSKAGEDPDIAPDIELNSLVKDIRFAFEPDETDTNCFTLNGRVYWCRIEGRSDFDPGDIDGQGKAVLPIRILIP